VKVALDTNVLVSAVATRGLCADIFNLVLAEHQLVIGVTVLGELGRVLRQKMRVPADIIEEFDTLLRREAVITGKVKALVIKIRDKSDVPVLAEAVAGGADVLVTGDLDLIEVADKAPIQILTPRGFWEQLREDSDSKPGH
jgi:putative PIN family toxin of toxin-antitoxin system